MAGPWEQFTPQAPAASASGPWTQFTPSDTAAQGEFGYAYVPAATAAPSATPPATSQRSVVDQRQPNQQTGYAANIAAGGNAAIASTLGLPVDLLTGGFNLGIRGMNALAGTAVPTIDHPMGGSETFKRAMGLIGANPDDVKADGFGQELARGAAGGAVGALLPGGIARGLGEAGVLAAPTVAQALHATGDLTKGNALLGAASGVGSEVASDAAPDSLKPLAGMVGGIVVPGVPMAAAAGLRAGARPTLNALTDYAGPAIGRANPLLDEAGAQFVTPGGVPLTANDAQARLAAKSIIGKASDPEAVRAALDNAPTPALPTAPPTAFQLTRDPGLGQAEFLDSKSGPAVADWRISQDKRNDAQVGAIQGIAPDATPAALPQALQRQAADIDAEHSAQVAAAQRQADAQVAQQQAALEAQRAAAQQATQSKLDQVQALGQTATAGAQQQAAEAARALPADLPPGSDAQVGAALRAPAVDAAAAARKVRGDLYDAIDPDGTLNVGIGPVKAAHAQLQGETTPFSAPRSAGEAGIMDQLGQAPDVVPFASLRDLQKRLTGSIRAARVDPERQEEVRRLSILLDGVHGSMADAANASDIPAAEAAKAAAPSPGPSVGSDVFTPSGQRVGVRYELADPASLVTSHGDDMRPNPAYPQELQPRDRGRAASELQVQNIRNGLQPERLGASNTIADGAPVVGPDNLVESGNARTMALRQVMADNGPKAQEYRDWLTSQGHDVSANPNQVLIRRRTTDLTPEERVALTREGNAPTTLAMSATERAAKDAGNLSDDVLQRYQHGPELGSEANRDFVRSFAQNVVDPAEQGSFATRDGTLSKEGAARIEAALVHRAYGDAGLTAALSEETDPAAKVLSGAMRDAAGPMARLKAGIEAGAVDPQVDLAPHLVEAANMVKSAKRQNLPLAKAVTQHDAFNQLSPQADAILRAAYGDSLSGRMSQTKMTDLLAEYARRAEQQTAGASLFDDKQSAQQVLDGVAAQYGKSAAQASNAAAGASPARAVDGQGGGGARRPGPRAAGQAAPGVGGGGQPSSGILPQPVAAPTEPVAAATVPAAPALAANFDAAARQRLLAANAQHAADVQTFRKAPGVGQILAPGPTQGTFKALDAQVPNLVVRAGPVGADVAKAYLKAGGTPEALSDAAAFSLRQAAMKDGVIDPAKYEAWARQRQSFLSQIPDAAAKFGAAADASRKAQDIAGAVGGAVKGAERLTEQKLAAIEKQHAAAMKDAAAAAQATVDDAAARRAQAVKAMQASAAGKFLGSADPVAQVRSILGGSTAVADMAHLARLTANDAEARAGLQAAVRDHILQNLKGDAKGGASAESYLFGGQMQSFLRQKEAALSQVMSPEQMRSLRSVADSLAETRLSNDGARVGTGSDTAQKTAGAGRAFVGKLAEQLGGLASGGGLGGAIGYGVAGAGGATVGANLGAAAGKVLQGMRQAGMAKVDDLVSQALINPALMKTLLAKATPANTPALMGNLASQLQRLSLVSAFRGAQPQQQPERRQAAPTRRNALLH